MKPQHTPDIDRIIYLLTTHSEGKLNDEEQAELQAWLDHTPGRAEIAEELRAEGFAGDLLSDWKPQAARASLSRVKDRIRRKDALRLWSRVAAAASVLLVMASGIWFYTSHTQSGSAQYANDIAPGKNMATLTLADGSRIDLSDAKTGVVIEASSLRYSDGEELGISSESGPRRGGPEVSSETPQFPGSRGAGRGTMIVSTPRGGTYQVVLEDGTKVWLNAASSLSFPAAFSGMDGQRVVRLQGEAYFEVAPDKKHPFVVKSAGQDVEVLGTHFNINSYAESSTKTTLLEGRVKVSSEQGGEGLLLKPNQQSILKDGAIRVEPADIKKAVAWKNGYFRFNEQRIEEVMVELARWYNIEVVYEGPVSEEKFSGYISRNKNISEVLDMFSYAQAVRFKIEGRRVTVMK